MIFEHQKKGAGSSNGERGYKTFFMLNSVEHEILNAHKYKHTGQKKLSPTCIFPIDKVQKHSDLSYCNFLLDLNFQTHAVFNEIIKNTSSLYVLRPISVVCFSADIHSF